MPDSEVRFSASAADRHEAPTERTPVEREQPLAHKEDRGAEKPDRTSADLGRRARLAYDQDRSSLFVEILDSKTGDVLYRFPSHELVEHIEKLLDQDGFSDEPNGAMFDKVA